MRHLPHLFLLVAVALGGCPGPSGFIECVDQTSCGLAVGGECLVNPETGNQFCAYPDASSPVGLRWSDYDVEDSITKMEVLRNRGVGFSLDDFGTGYSSLSYLKRLPLDQIKIDQGFIRDVLTDPNDAAIACTVIALAHSLGLEVVAEGVEAQGQRKFLLRNGCQRFQGYLFGRPGPAQDMAQG